MAKTKSAAKNENNNDVLVHRYNRIMSAYPQVKRE